MASEEQKLSQLQQQQQSSKLQIYSNCNTGISDFWKDKYEREAKKYWDIFYKRHQNKFFKDRHYLDKEWGSTSKVVLEWLILCYLMHLQVGCGAGNTIYPLIATYPDIFVHACDFSPRAVELVKSHEDFKLERVNAFVCDLTEDDLCKHILPSSVDIVTMIFVLSAVAPEKMPLVLQNIRKILKPNGFVLLRDYATGDLAQERLTCKDQKICENFYVRGDGTRAFYFSEEYLTSLFVENGFDVGEMGLCCKQVENRSRELVMNRRWIQAVFRLPSDNISCVSKCTNVGVIKESKSNGVKTSSKPTDDSDVDISDSIAAEMFGVSPSVDEIIKVDIGGHSFRVRGLTKDYQHTCKSTGLMLWESARLMSVVLAENPSIVAGRRVLELGCGCSGICSMIAARYADLVVATDGDTKALDLLNQNVPLNLKESILCKLVTRRLEWGNKNHIQEIKQINSNGFEVIIGTDVAYVAEAISPLFETARELISTNTGIQGDFKPALILCHVFRRVDEMSLLSTASQFGFRLVDRWPSDGKPNNSTQSIVKSWFSEKGYEEEFQNMALNIMYFQT
ncbi:hypothetical protein Syun_026435 [Stephania yunnanensis]|uniref:Methyltransferase type 12 domain-containing protein n=1 Tax=Stephania yunnanensis TaxID=152371 RepID=A0AAP0HX09_9MAGN